MNNNKYALPPRLWLDSVKKELGLSDLTPRTQIETLIENVNTHGLQLKIGVSAFSEVRLQRKEQGIDHEIDHHSGVHTGHSVGPTQWATDICSELTLLKITRSDSATILAWEVEVDGVPMYLVDVTDQFIISHGIDLDNAYMDLHDLERYNHRPTPPYADPQSEYYAPELALAVRLHEDIILKKIPQMYLTNMKDQVTSMLNKYDRNHRSSGEKISRLATIIGIKKKKAHPK